MIKWTYVVHQPTDQDGILLQEGEFEGVVYTVTDVKFPVYKEDGSIIDAKDADNIPLTFKLSLIHI